MQLHCCYFSFHALRCEPYLKLRRCKYSEIIHFSRASVNKKCRRKFVVFRAVYLIRSVMVKPQNIISVKAYYQAFVIFSAFACSACKRQAVRGQIFFNTLKTRLEAAAADVRPPVYFIFPCRFVKLCKVCAAFKYILYFGKLAVVRAHAFGNSTGLHKLIEDKPFIHAAALLVLSVVPPVHIPD